MSEKCAGCFCHTHGDNSTASEINADLLAAAEGVMGRSYLISPVTGRQLCVECSVYVGEEHSADCYIPALRAAIKKAKGQ